MKTLIYLASPYTHENPAVVHQRFDDVCRCAATLMEKGHHVFSPIAHTHPIAMVGKLPTHWEFWERYDRAIMECCGRMVVLMLPGWEESKGIKAEIKLAEEMGLPIVYIEQEITK